MTKTQYIANIIFFLPLAILNFFMYGADGVVRFVKEIKKERNKKK